MMNKEKESKFTYGDPVKIKIDSPSQFHPGEIGDICGMDQIITSEEAQTFLCEKEAWIYTVEFIDGSSIEIPERYLEKDPDRLSFAIGNSVIMKENIDSFYHPSEVLQVVNYHKISDSSLAKKFNLTVGDIIYVMKPEQGEEILIPEPFIEKKVEE